jgi:UDP-glucose:(heptosyl)LPS alpha-1,3-glucosyltransferase
MPQPSTNPQWSCPQADRYVEFAPGVRAHRGWVDWLRANLGDDFEAMRDPPAAQALDKPGLGPSRRRRRIEADGRTVFLKTYTLGDAAQREWDAVLALARIGIATMTRVALGRAPDGRSLLITAQVPGGVSLERWVRRRLADGRAPQGKSKQALVEALAELAARLHAAGWVHRDLYLSHVFVCGDGPPWRLHLIDLARCLRPLPWRIPRWVAKDLAELLYSMPKSVFDETDQATLLKHYAAVRPGAGRGLPSVSAVWRKVAQIRRHDGRRRMGRWPVTLPAPADPDGPLRVAIFIERLDPAYGGAERSTRQYAARLAARGHDVTVFTTAPGPPLEAVNVVSWQKGSRRARPRRRRFRQAAAEVAAAGEFHIYHSLGYTASHNVLQPRAGVAAVQRAAKHGGRRPRSTSRSRHVDACERQAFLLTPPPFVAPISRFVAAQIREHYPPCADRVVPVFNGIDLAPLELGDREAERRRIRGELGIAEDETLFLLVAHDFRLKGLAWMIRAAAGLGEAPYRCVVIGRGRPGPYRKLAAGLGIGSRLQFLGAVERVVAYYAAADVLVHPTLYDTCSRVVLEALASGLPVITTAQNGAAEILQDGDAGWVVSSADALDELAGAMRRSMDPTWRWAAGEAARALRPRIDIERHVDEMIALYRRVLKEAGG